MQQAMMMAFVIIIPLMPLSGLLTPVDNMPAWLQPVTAVNPLRWAVSIIRDVYLQGAHFADIAPALGVLLAIAACTLPPAALLFRRLQSLAAIAAACYSVFF